MQIGGADAGGVGDGVDLGLRAPIAADMGDGAPHDVVIRRRRGQRGEVGEAVGQGRRLRSWSCRLSRADCEGKPPDF